MEDQSNRAARRICGGLNKSLIASEHREDEANEVEWLKKQLGIKEELIEQLLAKLDAPINDTHNPDQSSHGIASASSRGTRFNTPGDQNISEGYERMLHAIHTWVFETTNNMTKQIKVKLDTPNHSWLASHMPRDVSQASNNVYWQHSLSCLIVHTVIDSLCDDNTFMRDSKNANRSLAEVEELLYRTGHHAEYQRWLNHTRVLIGKAEPGLLKRINDDREERLTRELRRAIREATNLTTADVDWSTLNQIVKPAVVFFTKAYYHPAKFTFKPYSTSPTGLEEEGGMVYDKLSHDDISGHCDGHWIVGIVYPGLQKIRDENGTKIAGATESSDTLKPDTTVGQYRVDYSQQAIQ